MKDIIQELNNYNVPIIKIDDSLAKVKQENRFSQKLADANAFLARAGVPKSFPTYSDEYPELSFERLTELYKAKGYPLEWIQERLMAIETRQHLIGQWQLRGVNEGQEFSILSAELLKNTFGLTPKEYHQFKGLNEKNSLRDNMTSPELYFTTLGEKYTLKEILKKNAQGFKENREAAILGGILASNDIKQLEQKQGIKVISNQNYVHLLKGENMINLDSVLL